MSTCQIRKGLFILRQCDEPAVGQCGKCQRLVCREHGHDVSLNLPDVPRTPQWRCVECQVAPSTLDPQHDLAYVFYRLQLKVDPAWADLSAPFDAGDISSFDQRGTDPGDQDDPDSDGNFGDS